MLTQQTKYIALSWLSGLNLEYGAICSQILSSKKFDNLIDVFFPVIQLSFVKSRATTTDSDSSDRTTLAIQSGGSGGFHNGDLLEVVYIKQPPSFVAQWGA